MKVGTRIARIVLSTVALAACETRPSTGIAGGSTATLRFINATATNIDVVSGSSVLTNNGNLGFGEHSSCVGLDAANPNVSVRATGTTTALTGFSPTVAVGGKYLVIAYRDAAGTTQFANFTSNGFTPNSGQSGLRVFDAATGSNNFDVYLTAPGAALSVASATNLSFANSTSFFGVDASTVQLRLTTSGSQTVVFNAGSQTLTAGQDYILVIAPPVSGSSELRSFLVMAC
ncbi:MAG: DUF4397 domain-containing protein [Gemmatimonadota bacterium]|nr:DUF4397 domain-containing protein [Gemmatimonadota bacterium]